MAQIHERLNRILKAQGIISWKYQLPQHEYDRLINKFRAHLKRRKANKAARKQRRINRLRAA